MRSARTFTAAVKTADGHVVRDLLGYPQNRAAARLDGRQIPVEIGQGHDVEIKIP
jgi:hypothetical protein